MIIYKILASVAAITACAWMLRAVVCDVREFLGEVRK